MIRKLLLLVIVLLTTATVEAIAQENVWTTLTDPAAVFTIQVPQKPEVSNLNTTDKNGVTVPVIQYVIDRGTTALMMMVSNFPPSEIGDPQAMTNGVVSGMTGHGRRILTNNSITRDGHEGRLVTLTDPDADQFSDQVFFINGHLYQVITEMPKDAPDDVVGMVARFNQSLHFVR